jgi:hypothetical protein
MTQTKDYSLLRAFNREQAEAGDEIALLMGCEPHLVSSLRVAHLIIRWSL